MNFSDFITDNGKRINKDHYIHLIQVSKVDGKISQPELDMLHREGRMFGLTDPEVDKLIGSESFDHYHPPYSLVDKFDQLYSITEIILADGVVTESEKKMLRRYAVVAGFRDDIIESLITLLLEGVSKGEDEEKLLKEFKTNYL